MSDNDTAWISGSHGFEAMKNLGKKTTNDKRLERIKQMAGEAGLEYYDDEFEFIVRKYTLTYEWVLVRRKKKTK